MLSTLKNELQKAIREGIAKAFDVDHEPVIEVPPRRELGDLAAPAGLHLARTLKRNPRQIAEELLPHVELPAGIREARIEGAGYLNVFLDRPAATQRWLSEDLIASSPERQSAKIVVEHTNINPNKAAHIGHLRNAVLGDILIRCLRKLGHPVEIQNYIDDTGVQVADVVVGFKDLRGLGAQEIRDLPDPFDYTCWDLYAEVGRWFEADAERTALRRETLHELESGEGERAEIGRLVAERIVGCHLATMARLDIGYDLLTHESEILRLDFFASAFEKLKESGAVRLETSGKNEGCWVMPLSESEEFQGLEDPDKVIVRSDGTVTYVGKDIAYQLWKFGLLGRDFEYTERSDYWQTAPNEHSDPPTQFGAAHRVVNVIDARQSYLQKIVRAGLEALGHASEADRSIHFAYEMVSLSKNTAVQLGYVDDDGEGKSVEMSGRKGVGVKADDMLDQLVAKSREEISKRNRELDPEDLDQLSREIMIAALRYFMVKATTTRVIPFDVDEALRFEGDSGPYLQYSMVRAKNILRKLEEAGLDSQVSPEAAGALSAELWSEDLWDLQFTAGQIQEVAERAADTLELSLIARQAVELAQKFNAFFHKHPMLHEEDADLRSVRLATTQLFLKAQGELVALLGIPAPERM